jgi:UDP-N-acetylmuramate dehydrogenase
VALAPLTTLELGGTARFFLDVGDRVELDEALRWARAESLPVTVLGGGSNVVVADSGLEGVVLRLGLSGYSVERRGGMARVTVAAGEPWDLVVARTVDDGLAGLECLSGIPGRTGATPIQNVGAYGAEVSEVVTEVHVLDRRDLVERRLDGEGCAFRYRGSRFRSEPDRYVVLSVSFLLRCDGRGRVRYPELASMLAGASAPEPARVREAVLELRRSKSMVLDPEDPNRRSVGSFFLNPVLTRGDLDALSRRLGGSLEVPRFELEDGRFKVPAAWLVEHAGYRRGTRTGRVGVSSRHSLALVHHGGGTAAELVSLAAEIRRGVRRLTGIDLMPEPTFVGFPVADPTASHCCT